MKTAVVILNWNTRDFLGKFLPPLLESVRGLDAGVIVADSASTDGSLDLLREHFSEVRTIPLEENYGFTGGYNRALAQVEAEYYVLINSDIEVPAHWLEPLSDFMDTHPECGACGPKLLSYYDRGRFEYAGAAGGCIDALGYTFCRGRVMKRVEVDSGQYDYAPSKVAWASGACLMVRSSLWEELGGLDERFFAHMEEVDLCWRMRLCGYDVVVVPSSEVYHIGGGTLPQTSPWKLELNFRNNLLMLHNNLAREFVALGSSETASRIRSRLLIGFRMALDLCSALVYLVSFKPSYASAVFKAHRQFRRLRTEPKPMTSVRAYSRHGYLNGSVVLLSLLTGEKIFDCLRKRVIL